MLVSKIALSFIDLLFPPLCLHCNETLGSEAKLFCHLCNSFMTLIPQEERCPYCFSSAVIQEQKMCCHNCVEHPLFFQGIASAFDYEGPPATLIKQLKYGGQTYLAKGAAAYIVAQFFTLDWPMPDLIVPMPSSRLKRLERGYNQSMLIAEHVGKLLERPVNDVLKRRSGDFSQAGLDHKQRQLLSSANFELKAGVCLCDKTILLIDDVMTTGSSLRCCAEAMLPAFPKEIYAMTFCRAM